MRMRHGGITWVPIGEAEQLREEIERLQTRVAIAKDVELNLLSEIERLQKELEIAQSMHEVAIKERDYERQRNKPIRLFGPEGEMEEL